MFTNSGGFFDEGNAPTKDFNNNTKKEQPDGEKRKPKMFVPVTFKLLHSATVNSDDHFEIEGEAIQDIIVVGRLLSRDEQPTRTTFDVNDNTGTFRVTFYHREENVLPKCLQNLDYEQDCYVKIFGSIRIFKDNRAIVGSHITNIVDFDELTNHFLQVFTASCVRRKGLLSNQDIQETTTGAMDENRVREFILETFKESSKGRPSINKDELFRSLKNKISYPEFEKGVKYLVDEMQLYEPETGVFSSF